MQHTESSIKVYQTYDYDRFRMINGNRGINLNKIQKIIKDVQGGNNMLPYKPIETNERGNMLDILDGQHRYIVSKKTNNPVFYFLVAEEKTMNNIATVNSLVDKWKYTDYINCYSAQNSQDYKELGEALNRYKTTPGITIVLFETGIPGKTSAGKLSENFFSGKFKIRHRMEALELLDLAKSFDFYDQWNCREFIISIYKIKKANLISMDELKDQLHKHKDKLLPQKSSKQFLFHLEQIFNTGKQKRCVIS